MLVTVPTFALLRRRQTPWREGSFHLPTQTRVEWRLLVGAAIFGSGWGDRGLLPWGCGSFVGKRESRDPAVLRCHNEWNVGGQSQRSYGLISPAMRWHYADRG